MALLSAEMIREIQSVGEAYSRSEIARRERVAQLRQDQQAGRERAPVATGGRRAGQ